MRVKNTLLVRVKDSWGGGLSYLDIVHRPAESQVLSCGENGFLSGPAWSLFLKVPFIKESFPASYRWSLGSNIFWMLKLGEQLARSQPWMWRVVPSLRQQRYVAETKRGFISVHHHSKLAKCLFLCIYKRYWKKLCVWELRIFALLPFGASEKRKDYLCLSRFCTYSATAGEGDLSLQQWGLPSLGEEQPLKT